MVFKRKLSKETKKEIMDYLNHLLVLIFSPVAILFSYLYGSSLPAVKTFSSLMAADHEVKSQKDISYLHGRLFLDDSFSNQASFDKEIELQYKTIYKQQYYDSYLVSSRDNEAVNYSVSTGIDNMQWNTASVVAVRNFWDSAMMESLGLPLFWINTSDNKNNIGAKHDEADFGSYISSTAAYDYVKNNGMLDAANGDVSAAFTALLADNPVYSIAYEDTTYSFSINNIYIDPDFSYLITSDHRSYANGLYDDYYKDFSYWNKNAIISYARNKTKNLMLDGCTLHFDVRNNYYNFDLFFKNVIGYDFAQNGMTIELSVQDKVLTEYSNNLNENSASQPSGNNLYLALAIIWFELTLIAHVSNIHFGSSKQPFARKLLVHSLPVIPFIVIQFVMHMMLLITKDYYLAYSAFYLTGNIVILAFLFSIIDVGVIWSLFDEKPNRKNKK